MEVGAVKHAFNNELILLKKKLNQAKTQVIHKLTRKAKTFVEKKVPDTLKEKLKRKAESAVNEVLIIKKIKPRDIAKFILTHDGKLQDYLNKPQVDQDKACARLLLHKALQDKYKYFRSRFCGVPINDLFMSRAERQKLKKEAREKQKEKLKKKKKQDNVVNSEGDWDVEDVKMSNNSQEIIGTEIVSDDNVSDNEAMSEDGDEQMELQKKESDDQDSDQQESDDDDKESSLIKQDLVKNSKGNSKESNVDEDVGSESGEESEISNDEDSAEIDTTQVNQFELKIGQQNNVKVKPTVKNPNKKQKEINKNKNFSEKMLNKKNKRNSNDTPAKEVKIVDPFFITSTGENYMSLAEPRAPDEVKEIHKQGNRKLRRAAMFGHTPRTKPRQDFREENHRFNNFNSKQNGFDRNPGGKDRQNFQQNDRFDRKENFVRNNFKDNRFDGQDNFKRNNFNDNKTSNFRDRSFNSNDDSAKPEKLHPSWEAKKRQSGILPFQGKKVVFDE